MTFLNPLLLWGALAVSVPILIHLLNKRKFERVVWAAMRFLQVSVEQNQRRVQIEDMILLALRCLLIALLALALARPAIKAAGAGRFLGQDPVTGVIILDNSYSMSATDGVQQRFEQAKRAADSILDAMPNGSSIALILGSDRANAVIPEPTFDLNLVRKTIQEARLSDRSTDIEPSIRTALETLKGRKTLRKEIYLLTDGQANGWEKMDDIRGELSDAKSEVHTQIVLVGSKLDANVGVTDLHLGDGDLPLADEPMTFVATLKNFGSTPAAEAHNVRVSLHVDDDPTAAEEVVDTLKAGESRTVHLSAKIHSVGSHTVTVSIPVETDRLPADDTRTLAVRTLKDISVLMVDGDPGAGSRQASTDIIRGFLADGYKTADGSSLVKVNTIAPSEMAGQRLDEYSVIVISNVTDLPHGVLDSLANYLRRGYGGLIVFPGNFTSTRFYNDELVGKYHFLPASLGTARGNADENNDRIYFTLQGGNYNNEITRMWNSPNSGSPTSIKVWRAFELIPDAATKKTEEKPAGGNDPWVSYAGAPEIVLSYSKGVGDASLDSKPAIMQRRWGMGRVFEFSTTADRKWNTLGDDVPVYLPLFNKIVSVIVRRQDDQINIKVGDKFVYHPSDEMVGKDAMIFRPGQKTAVDSREVEMVSGLPQITFDDVDNAGAYEIRFPGSPPVQFAAYADPRESELEELDAGQIERLSTAATVTRWNGEQSIGAMIEKGRVGTELWMTLACVALVLAGLEAVLAQYFSRTK